MNNSYSIVIPTMWKSNKIHAMLEIYEKSMYVKEVILIDNDPKFSPLCDYSKIKKITKGKNIYVNPAWNWGASLSKYNLIIANDDIIIRRIDEVLFEISKSDYDIVGACLGQSDTDISIKDINIFPRKSYGCFMYIRYYEQLPEDLKIYRGDYILFNKCKKRGILQGVNIETGVSETIKSDRTFRKIINKDKILWKQKYLKG